MRLVDVVNQVRRRASEGTNFVRYPVQVISQAVRRVGQQWYENAQWTGGDAKQNGDRQNTPIEPVNGGQPVEPKATVATAPASFLSPIPHTASAIGEAKYSLAAYSLEIGSELQPGKLLQSRHNKYTVVNCIEAGDRMRLYTAKTRSDESVLVKEYQLFDYDFTPAQIEERLKAFEQLYELNQKIGHGPDFRIVKLVDAITSPKERKGYLITKPIDHNTTLETYLANQGLTSAKQIREVLRQVLESLRFLHTAYRVHFSYGEAERGLPHGNLSLKSLLVRQVEAGGNYNQQFFIYLSDLNLWEHLFYPPASPHFRATIAKSTDNLGSVKQDLEDLGLISLHLAGGTLISMEGESPVSEKQLVCDLNDPPLLHFIQRLLGLGIPFNTAEEALHTLLKLPESIPLAPLVASAEQHEEERVAKKGKVILAIALLLGILGLMTWWFTRRGITPNTADLPLPLGEGAPEVSKIENESSPRTFTYMVEPGGEWDYALARQFISNPTSRSGFRGNLIEAIDFRHPGIAQSPSKVNFQRDTVTNQLTLGKADVALVELPETLSENLEKEVVAYDALVVFVPFGDPYSFDQTAIVQELNRSITVEQLRQLYTGDEDIVTFPGEQFQVKLFFSEDEETVKRFKEQVLRDATPEEIRKFDQLKEKVEKRDREAANADGEPRDVYNRIWVDFNQANNDNIIGIGFDRLGRMYDQCSVYPLEVSKGGQTAVQVLVQSDGEAIDQNTDLCKAKGSYFPNIEDYPLKYELAVVYPKDSPEAGRALAAMLRTTEGQYLMSEVGLVPEEPFLALLSAVWGDADD